MISSISPKILIFNAPDMTNSSLCLLNEYLDTQYEVALSLKNADRTSELIESQLINSNIYCNIYESG